MTPEIMAGFCILGLLVVASHVASYFLLSGLLYYIIGELDDAKDKHKTADDRD